MCHMTKSPLDLTRAVFIVLLTLGLLAGCTRVVGKMKIPQLPPAGDVPPLESTRDSATFALSKVVATIRRGTVVAHFPGTETDEQGMDICNPGLTSNPQIEWTTGRSFLGNWSTALGEIFYEVLTENGFDIAGDPQALFKREDAIRSAEYLIGARIAEMRSNYCTLFDGNGIAQGYSGETYLRIEWSVFSKLTQQTIFRHENTGYHQVEEPKRLGTNFLFQEAFAEAALRLANHSDFRAIATRDYARKSPAEGYRETLWLAGGGLRDKELGKDFSAILPSVATIRIGLVHGSGFIIGRRGHLLTNAHVVGASKRVSVILNNGIEIDGEVLRTNEARDVALVKIPVRTPNPLPIRAAKTRRAERVYAVGSPILERLRSTVTAGIVSAHRTDPLNGKPFIQSDAAISPGNSGGPLLDRFGNVVGISALKATSPGVEGIGLFIPIVDALAAINVSVAAE